MKTMNHKSTRADVLAWAKTQYGTDPEYLWRSAPNDCVLRHGDNRKWYGIIMDIPRNKPGLPGEEIVDVLDVKVDPLLTGSLPDGKGIFPGYHMQKGHWITLLLDGTVAENQIHTLLDMSFELTSQRKKGTGKRNQ